MEKGKGLRYNDGKLRYDLEQPQARRDLIEVLTYGAKKYTIYDENGVMISNGDRNWELGMKWSKVIASAKRHLEAIERGEDFDYDEHCDGCKNGNCKSHSGLLHASHLQANAHIINSYYYLYPQGDDRKKITQTIPRIGLDIDEVLADWVGSWVKKYDMKERPKFWRFDRELPNRMKTMKENDELDQFYLDLKPIVNPDDLIFEPVCYVTARPVSNDITVKWLDIHGFPAAEVITVAMNESKLEILKEKKVEIFIDDKYETFLELNNNGILCYLYDRPHNRRYNVGHLRIHSLDELPIFGKIFLKK